MDSCDKCATVRRRRRRRTWAAPRAKTPQAKLPDVANAVEDMKPQCDYVCQATCDESAVAEVIERFVLT